jgi:hypothetical protein
MLLSTGDTPRQYTNWLLRSGCSSARVKQAQIKFAAASGTSTANCGVELAYSITSKKCTTGTPLHLVEVQQLQNPFVPRRACFQPLSPHTTAVNTKHNGSPHLHNPALLEVPALLHLQLQPRRSSHCYANSLPRLLPCCPPTQPVSFATSRVMPTLSFLWGSYRAGVAVL